MNNKNTKMGMPLYKRRDSIVNEINTCIEKEVNKYAKINHHKTPKPKPRSKTSLLERSPEIKHTISDVYNKKISVLEL
tara:strand:- start:197 stop:430 length:234 start_codon:yes stop_codon:yes gene_type:complete